MTLDEIRNVLGQVKIGEPVSLPMANALNDLADHVARIDAHLHSIGESLDRLGEAVNERDPRKPF